MLVFFLCDYHLFSPEISNNLQRCPVLTLTAERPPFALPQTYVTRKTSRNLVYMEGPVEDSVK